jgi:Zn-finger nucleic acid-binding protein
MNCPNCGAALTPVANRDLFRCEYCQTVQVPAVNPDGLVPLDRDHRFDCPCCQKRLKVGRIEGKGVAHCPACHGFLARSADFATILGRRRSRRRKGNPSPRPIDPTEFRRTLSCPSCRKTMDAHPYGAGGTAVIDSCHRCHLVWLDLGELAVLEQHAPRRV